MAQIVIFAPAGVDASAAEEALKSAGHEVEVVEAKAENLLHMAIGMLETAGEEAPAEEPAAEEPAEETPAEEPAAEAPAEETPAEETPAKMESLGTCAIDGDKVPAKKGKHTRLFVKEITKSSFGDKITFHLNENIISTWENKHRFMLTAPNGQLTGVSAQVVKSKFGETYLEVGPELYQYF